MVVLNNSFFSYSTVYSWIIFPTRFSINQERFKSIVGPFRTPAYQHCTPYSPLKDSYSFLTPHIYIKIILPLLLYLANVIASVPLVSCKTFLVGTTFSSSLLLFPKTSIQNRTVSKMYSSISGHATLVEAACVSCLPRRHLLMRSSQTICRSSSRTFTLWFIMNSSLA